MQDTISPNNSCYVMVISREDEREAGVPPYWIAQVIAIFHANVYHTDPGAHHDASQPMEFLWVRWFGRDPGFRAGWDAHRLHRIGFVSNDDPLVFGLLDPSQAIRGVHLIPAFAHGRTTILLPPSIIRSEEDNDEDWQYYYINMFVINSFLFEI